MLEMDLDLTIATCFRASVIKESSILSPELSEGKAEGEAKGEAKGKAEGEAKARPAH